MKLHGVEYASQLARASTSARIVHDDGRELAEKTG